MIGSLLFPVGFCMLYLLGYDLLTGVFMLTPLALIDRRPGVTAGGVLRNWGLVFVGNFAGALLVAVMMAFVFTYGFTSPPGPVGEKLAGIGVARTLGYAGHGMGGWFTIFVRGMLCNWMVSTGVVGAMISTHVSGKVIKVHTKNSDYKGYTHHASPDDPQYEIKSDKTDHIAMHKGPALKKTSV